MSKIVIVATYYDRLPQLEKTVRSLNKYNRSDFEMVVVDDGSPREIPRLMNNFPLAVIRLTDKTWFNSAIPYNHGFQFALSRNPEIIIIQNAESYHAGDILGYAEQHLTEENYISFACYSLSRIDTIPPRKLSTEKARFDGQSTWYNHPKYRPVGYHFCSAITANNLRKINGFDERFKDGCDWEDNYLLHQITSLGLHVEIPADPYVFHQWHYSSPRPKGTANNQALYDGLIGSKDYRAVHLITPDLS